MYTFCSAILCLIVGYLLYGAFVERVFGVDSQRKTPCFTKNDGVDFMPLPTWKVFLIQFLNIAGTGPIFGAVMGILFGPAAYLWIVFGCIFAGATHDYLSGMISLRKGGASLPEIVGDQLGSAARMSMRIFSLVLLVLVGAVFVTTPAELLTNMTSSLGSIFTSSFWVLLILFYYILATLLPIDAVIGKLYPLFGIALLVMALGVGIGIFTHDGWMPEITDGLTGHHPKGLSVFPMLCITIACGAISGFHATQSPMMARCMKNEKDGRKIFYLSMITEGAVALIWAAAAIKFAGSYEELAKMGNPALIVNTICNSWLGTLGSVLAILGVVAAPITSGDTAFRSARLILSDMLRFKQDKFWKRMAISFPLFVIAIILMTVNFDILWRYFAWFNQTLGCITLWAIAVWLLRNGKCYWIALLPALFMTVVSCSYILVAPEGLSLPLSYGITGGLLLMVLLSVLFAFKVFDFLKKREK